MTFTATGKYVYPTAILYLPTLWGHHLAKVLYPGTLCAWLSTQYRQQSRVHLARMDDQADKRPRRYLAVFPGSAYLLLIAALHT